MKEFFKRIDYQGKIDDISLIICRDFNIGNFISNELVTVGYEDFNYILKTTRGTYFIKIFSNFRTNADCDTYVNTMSKVLEMGISFPKLFKFKHDYLYKVTVNGVKLRLCVMEYIDGDNYYFLQQKPNENEIKFLSHQAALINSINIKPNFVYDQWATTNFLNEFQKKGRYLSSQDLKIIKPLVQKVRDVDIDKLPHCFVHGDIIATNVMKDNNGKLWIIDFAVSNYYPRIQELAVLACNMLFVEGNKHKTANNLELALKEYQKIIKLTSKEIGVLPTYIQLAHAMHILLPNYEKEVENNNSEENEYWLNQGRTGLKQTLID